MLVVVLGEFCYNKHYSDQLNLFIHCCYCDLM